MRDWDYQPLKKFLAWSVQELQRWARGTNTWFRSFSELVTASLLPLPPDKLNPTNSSIGKSKWYHMTHAHKKKIINRFRSLSEGKVLHEMLRFFTPITFPVIYLQRYQDFLEKFRAGTRVLWDFFIRSDLPEAEMRWILSPNKCSCKNEFADC